MSSYDYNTFCLRCCKTYSIASTILEDFIFCNDCGAMYIIEAKCLVSLTFPMKKYTVCLNFEDKKTRVNRLDNNVSVTLGTLVKPNLTLEQLEKYLIFT